MMSSFLVTLIASAILVLAVVALSFSKSRILDVILFSGFYLAAAVTVTAAIVEFLSRTL